MSIMNTIKCWLGQHNTASENHFIDGSVANKLSIKRGTPASPGAEVLKIDAGVVSFPNQGAVMAWCKFNGTLTGTNAPLGGGNVTSVTRTSTGLYVINFTTAIVDSNYAASVVSERYMNRAVTYSTTSLTIDTRDSAGNLADSSIVSVCVFR